jgi:hypothetical protein
VQSKGQTFPACGSARSAGQRPVRQRSLSAESIFFTFDASKVKGHCGYEQTNIHQKHNLYAKPCCSLAQMS